MPISDRTAHAVDKGERSLHFADLMPPKSQSSFWQGEMNPAVPRLGAFCWFSNRVGVAIFFLSLVFVCTACGYDGGRADFLFKLQTALKTSDYPGLANCFELEGTEADTQRMLWKLLDQLVKWPSHQVKVTERSQTGPFVMEKNGRSFTLNGDWTFQVHIHRGEPPSRSFVFPAGIGKSGKYAILMSVPVSKD